MSSRHSLAVGGLLLLRCEDPGGDPLLWYKDRVRVTEDSRTDIYAPQQQGPSLSVLSVENTVTGDGGVYECRSQLDPMFSTDSITVNIHQPGDAGSHRQTGKSGEARGSVSQQGRGYGVTRLLS